MKKIITKTAYNVAEILPWILAILRQYCLGYNIKEILSQYWGNVTVHFFKKRIFKTFLILFLFSYFLQYFVPLSVKKWENSSVLKLVVNNFYSKRKITLVIVW